MSSGGSQVKINNLERAVSNDINRAESLLHRDIAQSLLRLFAYNRATIFEDRGLATNVDSFDGAPIGVNNESVGVTADVFDGLMVMPQLGSLNLFVTAGVVGLVDPDGQAGSSNAGTPSPDDSRYKVVNDLGVHTNGVLVVAAGGGGIRIDVVECQRVTTTTEQASRDIYNPATGLFTPSTVDKVVVGQLVYRVRQGTPGAGFPGAVQGWLPLAVISVPATSTTVDTMRFWDVRPLVYARNHGHRITTRFNDPAGTIEQNSHVTTAGVAVGWRIDEGADGYRHSGDYLAPANLTTNNAVDLTNAIVQEPGYVANVNGLWYLYEVLPDYHLPRWQAYSSLTSPPSPVGTSGIFVLSSSPVTPAGIPAAYGFTSVVNATVRLLLAGFNSASTAGPVSANKDQIRVGVIQTLAPGTSVLATDTYSATTGIANMGSWAKTIFAQFSTKLTGTVNAFVTLKWTLTSTANGGKQIETGYVNATYDAAGFAFVSFTTELMQAINGIQCTVDWTMVQGTAPTARTVPAVQILGWRI